MLVPQHVTWRPGLVWVLEDVMLVPGHVVWGPGLVWVLQQVGAVPKKKSVSPRGFKRPFFGRAAHPAAIFLQLACAHRNDISFSAVYSQSVILSLQEAVSCSDYRLPTAACSPTHALVHQQLEVV